MPRLLGIKGYLGVVTFSQSSTLISGACFSARYPRGSYFFFCSSFRTDRICAIVDSPKARNMLIRSEPEMDVLLTIILTFSYLRCRIPFTADCCASSKSKALAKRLTRSSRLSLLDTVRVCFDALVLGESCAIAGHRCQKKMAKTRVRAVRPAQTNGFVLAIPGSLPSNTIGEG